MALQEVADAKAVGLLADRLNEACAAAGVAACWRHRVSETYLGPCSRNDYGAFLWNETDVLSASSDGFATLSEEDRRTYLKVSRTDDSRPLIRSPFYGIFKARAALCNSLAKPYMQFVCWCLMSIHKARWHTSFLRELAADMRSS